MTCRAVGNGFRLGIFTSSANAVARPVRNAGCLVLSPFVIVVERRFSVSSFARTAGTAKIYIVAFFRTFRRNRHIERKLAGVRTAVRTAVVSASRIISAVRTAVIISVAIRTAVSRAVTRTVRIFVISRTAVSRIARRGRGSVLFGALLSARSVVFFRILVRVLLPLPLSKP